MTTSTIVNNALNSISNSSNTQGNNTMNISSVEFKITWGSTCASVGGFFNATLSIPVSDITATSVVNALDLFSHYAPHDAKVHFQDTFDFVSEEYKKENTSTALLSVEQFVAIITEVYASKEGIKEFVEVTSYVLNPTATQGTNIMTNQITFEQAVYNRIGTCRTWNYKRLNEVVSGMWTKDTTALRSETTGEFLDLFFKAFHSDLTARRFSFFDTHIVEGIYNRTWNSFTQPATDYIKDVIAPALDLAPVVETEEEAVQPKPSIYTVNTYTDGSCKVGARTGGWGVFISIEGYSKFDKEVSGNQSDTTSSQMELKAMIEALKAVNTNKEGYIYNFYTDSRYVLQAIANRTKYAVEGFKKAANVEMLQELYTVMAEKGIILSVCTKVVTSNKDIQSGDVVHSAKEGTINFIWVKGHSGDGGNDKADKLATSARKVLDKAAKKSSGPTVAEETIEAVVEAEEVVALQVTEEMIKEAKTFEDIKTIISYSKTLELGGTCSEEFAHYTKVLLNGKSLFEIESPERVASREFCIKAAVRNLVPHLIAEGVYVVSDSEVDSSSNSVEDSNADSLADSTHESSKSNSVTKK